MSVTNLAIESRYIDPFIPRDQFKFFLDGSPEVLGRFVFLIRLHIAYLASFSFFLISTLDR
jgi:hypothetical protein